MKDSMKPTALHFNHNGRPISVFADGGESLLSLLRLKVGDQTPKYGCGQGGCGACSVRIDGELRLHAYLAETVDGQTLRRLHQSLLQILTPYKLLLWKILQLSVATAHQE